MPDLNQCGVPFWALYATQQALDATSPPTMREHNSRISQTSNTIKAMHDAAWLVDFLLPIKSHTTADQDMAISAMFLVLDLAAPRVRAPCFAHLGTAAWNRADAADYRRASRHAVRLLDHDLRLDQDDMRPLDDRIIDTLMDTPVPEFEVAVDYATGLPLDIQWGQLTVPWPQLKWTYTEMETWPDMTLQGLAAMRLSEIIGVQQYTQTMALSVLRSIHTSLARAKDPRVKPTLETTLEAYTEDALSDNANDVIHLAGLIPTLKRLHDISTTAFASRFAEDVRQGQHTTARQAAVTVFGFKINFDLVDRWRAAQ